MDDKVKIATACRFCEAELSAPFLDLGAMPLANSFLEKTDGIHNEQPTYPLAVCICPNCLLVQLKHTADPKHIFSDYAYFSSYSLTWLKHAENYTHHIRELFELNNNSKILEIGSNDGYLLKNFAKAGMDVLGIEPAENVAEKAKASGIQTMTVFFSKELATTLQSSTGGFDLIIANNVLAHCPNINSFIAGIKILLTENGIASLEFPHLLNIINLNQFDTIYHEHYFYFSILALMKIFTKHNLDIFRVEKLDTHGGSLRIFVKHSGCDKLKKDQTASDIISLEKNAKLDQLETYSSFPLHVEKIKKDLLNCLHQNKTQGKLIAAYGAPAKGNTLLNYCKITNSLIDFTVDKNPYKQGRILPGSKIPIYEPAHIKTTQPDIILILPWNITQEITSEIKSNFIWKGQFVTAIPKVKSFKIGDNP
jgi:SAM-dependent methyltransferase